MSGVVLKFSRACGAQTFTIGTQILWSSALYHFTILLQNPLTFTEPSPNATYPGRV